MSNLSVIMPSNRPLATSAASIDTAIIFAEETGSRLIISDNSGDLEKARHYKDSSANLLYLISTAATALENMMNGFAHLTTPFMMVMGDDDAVYRLEGMTSFDLSMIQSEIIGIRPRSMLWSLADGVTAVDNLALLSDNAGDRIMEYNKSLKKINSMFYSIYRTQPFRAIFDLLADHHPTRGDYSDWAVTTTLIACGRIIHDPSIIFRYDLGRWATDDAIKASTLSLFRGAGLPDHAVHFESLLRFADTFVMLGLARLPIARAERKHAQWADARMGLNSFVSTYRNSPHLFDPSVAKYANYFGTAPEPELAFQAILPLLDDLKPGLAAGYQRFYHAALNC